MRTLGRSLLCGLFGVVLFGCGTERAAENVARSSAAPAPKSAEGAADRPSVSMGGGGMPGSPGMGGVPKSGPAPRPSGDADAAPAMVGPAKPAAGEAMAGVERPSRPRQKEPQSGILTAGSFDDNLNPQFLRSFAGKFGQGTGVGDLPGRLFGHRLQLVVKNGAGQPVGNARVRVAPAGGNPIELTTRTDGRVVLLTSWDQLPTDADFTVTVTPPDGTPPVTQTVPRSAPKWEITLESAQAPLPQHLDVLIVFDTTGSMGDELEFLKSEMKSIAATVHDKFPQVSKRYGLILYRDDGDEYVTRSFDFTPSIDAFRQNLAGQRAGGGGDEPEAMHRALEDALQLRWREGNAARVLFLIADAPPHLQHMNRTLAAADKLRRQGTAIYPVACSGYRDACEIVLRSLAVVTGSQFLFLTDDSGVGNPHAEPHIPFYHVQRLDQMMIRMIAGELSGKRIEPEPDQIIRSVGKPIN